MRRILLARVLGRFPCWQVSCPACERPGRRGVLGEVGVLVAAHNGLLHRGHPVASARLAVSI